MNIINFILIKIKEWLLFNFTFGMKIFDDKNEFHYMKNKEVIDRTNANTNPAPPDTTELIAEFALLIIRFRNDRYPYNEDIVLYPSI